MEFRKEDASETKLSDVETNEKISRRQWIGTAAKASLAAMTVASMTESASPQQIAELPFDIHQHVHAPVDENLSEIMSANAWIEKDYNGRIKLMDENGIGKKTGPSGLKWQRAAPYDRAPGRFAAREPTALRRRRAEQYHRVAELARFGSSPWQ